MDSVTQALETEDVEAHGKWVRSRTRGPAARARPSGGLPTGPTHPQPLCNFEWESTPVTNDICPCSS